MGRKKAVSLVDASTVARAEADFKALQGDKVAQRLLAILSVGQDRSLDDVASVLRVTRQSVSKWIQSYKKGGVPGLEDRPKGHRRSRLSVTEQHKIQGWLERGVAPNGTPTHWTIDILRTTILEQFEVRFGKTRVWQLLHSWGYKLKVPRPRHAKADQKAENALINNPKIG